MKPLPEGKSLGWMQAPASWIGSHTVRFIGVVRVVIQDGEGFILIKKGKPLFYYFKQGTIELKGHTALDYFNSHPVIEFNLCKYNPDELAWAMKLCNIEDPDRVVPKGPVVSGSVSREPTAPSLTPVPPVAKPVRDAGIPDPVVIAHPVPTVSKEPAVYRIGIMGTQPSLTPSSSTGRKTCQGYRNPGPGRSSTPGSHGYQRTGCSRIGIPGTQPSLTHSSSTGRKTCPGHKNPGPGRSSTTGSHG